jgi:phosphoglycerate dehydrogenase-like enzyme
MLEAAGENLKAVFLLEPGAAQIAKTNIPVHPIGNPALLGVAEHTVLFMLALAKRLPWILEKTRKKEWLPDRSKPTLTNQKEYTYNWVDLKDFGVLGGRTVGFVGLGYIGKATARILKGFSANMIYYKPKRLPKTEEIELGVEWRELDDLLEQSDYVSLHHRFVEGPEGNDKQFGSEAFRRMKRTAFFINTARGRMVDEDALCDAIASGQIAGAALDVFRYEPLPDDHPFFSLPEEKMILTPHLGGVPMKEAAEATARGIVDLLAAHERP